MTKQELLNTAKPILFNSEMVQSILEGRKTVTRRLIKHNPVECESKLVNGICKLCDDKGGFFLPEDYVKVRSYYQPGDILYVRETWCELSFGYVYKADGEKIDHLGNVIKWRPSIHMPKEAARIFLRVTSVGIERLGDITVQGIHDEGLGGDEEISLGEIKEFEQLWNGTVKPTDLDKYGWDANPWVWVISFETVRQEVK